MKVALLARSTLHNIFGGDTVQITATAKYLRAIGVSADIKLAHEQIDYASYDLLHVFNVIRPADSLRHVQASGKPYVLSTIYVDFSEYEKLQRSGLAKYATRLLSGDQLEYAKAILRQLKNGERIQSPEYLRIGHRRAVRKLARNAALLLPNSLSEMKRFEESYGISRKFRVIYNGIDDATFQKADHNVCERQNNLVICVARIEGKKNQLNLIKALNDTEFQLKLIGKPAPNHLRYYEACRYTASSNVSFEGFVKQEDLAQFYQKAKVHILPSWNETCGLSSLEAAYYGCNIVITDKGDTREYYEDDAWYCDPGDPDSILNSVRLAAQAPATDIIQQKVMTQFNWRQAAIETMEAYKEVLGNLKG